MDSPLDGITVVELGSSVAAPYATWILAMLGAEVIKVERPGAGDDCRHWGPQRFAGQSVWFHQLNAGKRSITCDLRQAGERQRLRAYIRRHADVVVQNLRPGGVERLGLDAATLCTADPRLVYCNIGAYGAGGPLAERPGYDPLMQAFGGIMSITGEPGRPPVRVGCSIIDMGTGMWCAIGVLAALTRRARSGRGGVVDTALFATAIAWCAIPAADYLASGEVPGRHGSGISGIVPYQAYRCADGYLVVGGGNDRLFAALCEVLAHPEWAADPRFATNPARVEHREALNALLEPAFAAAPRARWQAGLEAAGVPCAPIQDLAEVCAHAQTEALGMIGELAGGLRLIAPPLVLDGERPRPASPAPALGADDAILEEEP